MTPYMKADEIATAFNASAQRNYWAARAAGSRGMPAVAFTSRGCMVRIHYCIKTQRFNVSFTKTAVAFGDFMSGIHRALYQVLTGLKAGGMDIAAPVDERTGVLRIEYDPITKEAYISAAKTGDDWLDADPMAFKVFE